MRMPYEENGPGARKYRYPRVVACVAHRTRDIGEPKESESALDS